jgi:cell division protein FtsQ
MKNIKMALNKRQWMISLSLLLLILLIFLWSKLNFTGKNRMISEINVQIEADTNCQFLNPQEVTKAIETKFGSPIGKSAAEISLTKIEQVLSAIPYIEKVTAYVGFDGVLKLKIRERKPMIQIVNDLGQEFYLDSFGIQIPKKENCQPNILIANGKINIASKPGKASKLPIATELLNLGKFMHYNPYWDAQFEQCYVDNYNQLLLIPRVGSHSIAIDNTQNMSQKFENLSLFYRKGLQTVGWNKYVQIDLSIPNQVIGRLSDVETEHKETKTVQKPTH